MRLRVFLQGRRCPHSFATQISWHRACKHMFWCSCHCPVLSSAAGPVVQRRGLVGLTSETKHHKAVCQLLNTLVIATLGTHGWTSLSVNMNCSTEVHKDQCNASEDHFQSLQIGLSHYDQGQLWIEDPKGCIYLEHHRDGLLRGSAHNTQATASLFHAQKHYHATLPWSNGDRVVLIAYVARQHACAVQRYGGILEGLALSCHIARRIACQASPTPLRTWMWILNLGSRVSLARQM